MATLERKDPERGATVARGEIQDLLSGVSDRADLELLFRKEIPLGEILRLASRRVSPGRVSALLESRDVPGELRRLLGT